MKNQIIAITVAAVLMTAAVFAGAAFLLRGGSDGGSDSVGASGATTTSVAEEASASSAANVPARPDCPAPGAGGIALPCLGGENGAETQDEQLTVVNVWAWWCGPCRDELPYFEDYAEQNPDVQVVGVHADTNAGNGAAFLNDLDIDIPSYQDSDNTFAGTLGLPSVIPITVVFQGTEQLAMYATPFESTEELAAAVDAAVAEQA